MLPREARKGWDFPGFTGLSEGGIAVLAFDEALTRGESNCVRTPPLNCREFAFGKYGGRGGIRTHGAFNSTLDFESSAFDRTQPPFL